MTLNPSDEYDFNFSKEICRIAREVLSISSSKLFSISIVQALRESASLDDVMASSSFDCPRSPCVAAYADIKRASLSI